MKYRSNLSLVIIFGISAILTIVLFGKEIEGANLIGVIISNFITAHYSYKRGKDDDNDND